MKSINNLMHQLFCPLVGNHNVEMRIAKENEDPWVSIMKSNRTMQPFFFQIIESAIPPFLIQRIKAIKLSLIHI